MNFITTPKEFSLSNNREFEKFQGFQVALTGRNWSGQEYATLRDGKHFLRELRGFEKQFLQLTPGMNERFNVNALIDVSLFKNTIPDNGSLIELLEDLEVFYEVDEDDQERKNTAKKYQKKLKSYSAKLENVPLLYRWYFSNQEHPFSQELKINLDTMLMQLGKKVKKNIDAHEDEVFGTLALSQGIQEMEQKYSDDMDEDEFSDLYPTKIANLYREYQGILANEVYLKSAIPTSEYFSKLFKHAFDEPSLFFYSLYAVGHYFEGHDKFSENAGTFILFERKKDKIESFVLYANEHMTERFLRNEFLFADLKKIGLHPVSQENFFELEAPNTVQEDEKVNFFKKVAEGMSKRIDVEKINKTLLTKSWFYELPQEFDNLLGIDTISFKSISVIEGPEGPEIFIKGLVYNEEGDSYYFPVLNPNSWEGMNSIQCAVVAYSICLIYDLTKAGNFELVANPYKEKPEPPKVVNSKLLKSRMRASANKHKGAVSKYKANLAPEVLLWFKAIDDRYKVGSSTLELHLKHLYEYELIIENSSFDVNWLQENWFAEEQEII